MFEVPLGITRPRTTETLRHAAVKEFMPQDTLTTQDIEHFATWVKRACSPWACRCICDAQAQTRSCRHPHIACRCIPPPPFKNGDTHTHTRTQYTYVGPLAGSRKCCDLRVGMCILNFTAQDDALQQTCLITSPELRWSLHKHNTGD